jgi:hypothetical protein
MSDMSLPPVLQFRFIKFSLREDVLPLRLLANTMPSFIHVLLPTRQLRITGSVVYLLISLSEPARYYT